MPMADAELEKLDSPEIWVNTNEAVEITGYNHEHVRKLARDNWNLPENERIIRVRRRVGRYDLWLPDLISYLKDIRHGPRPAAQKNQFNPDT
jgi:hypothetical protein